MRLSRLLPCLLSLSLVVALDDTQGPAIGIDLGTTYCCVGVFRKGQVEIIPNDQGNLTTPSYVAWTPDGHMLIGEAAKNQASDNPKNTVYDVKRLIGRTYKQCEEEIKKLHYEVINKNEKPKIVVYPNNKRREYYPEEISSYLIGKMKTIAEEYLRTEVFKAVITIPAYFDNSQRQATKNAGTIAKLEVQRTINEPTAAAMAFGLNKVIKKQKNIVVYDLGGGTFDVSVLVMDDGVFEIKAVKGDTHLGGEDFDRNISNYIVNKFTEKYGAVNLTDLNLAAIRVKSEELKKKLSWSTSHEITFDDLAGHAFSLKMTRKVFEDINMHFFKKTIDIIADTLKDAKFKKTDITDIVLVGGSTRIPKIRSMISEFFGRSDLCVDINPDEAVAYGAAVQAAILTQQAGTDSLLVIDVTPLTLGIETLGGVCTPVISRNTSIPIHRDQVFSTASENQTQVSIEIYEGERPMARDNKLLGKFILSGIPPMPKGAPEIVVTFDIDANGILKVSAYEKSTKNTNSITITNQNRTSSKQEIDEMIQKAEKYKEEDNRARERTLALNTFDSYLYSIKNTMKNTQFTASLNKNEVEEVETAVKSAEHWYQQFGPNATTEEIQEQQNKLNEVFGAISSKAQQAGAAPQPEEAREEEPMDEEL